ncbi:hypothetical protein BH20ACT2_BH20ACT2_25150 [soil metagenome]
MAPLLPRIAALGALGNAGAVANARRALDEERRRAWVVEALARRLPPTATDSSATPLAVGASHSAAGASAPAA